MVLVQKRPFFQNQKFKKWKKRHFSKGVNSWFWSKNGGFFFNFFFRQWRPGKCLLERKNAFLGYKKKKFKKLENLCFFKGVNPCLWSKSGQFSNFFLGNIGQEKVSDYILERKNAFLGYKNKKFKQSKNCHFSKGVNSWFWSKKGHFSNFFYQAIQAR